LSAISALTGDEAAVALGQSRTLPDVAEQHVVGELGQLGRDVAHQLLGAGLLRPP
jgi:hypothetical protein